MRTWGWTDCWPCRWSLELWSWVALSQDLISVLVSPSCITTSSSPRPSRYHWTTESMVRSWWVVCLAAMPPLTHPLTHGLNSCPRIFRSSPSDNSDEPISRIQSCHCYRRTSASWYTPSSQYCSRCLPWLRIAESCPCTREQWSSGWEETMCEWSNLALRILSHQLTKYHTLDLGNLWLPPSTSWSTGWVPRSGTSSSCSWGSLPWSAWCDASGILTWEEFYSSRWCQTFGWSNEPVLQDYMELNILACLPILRTPLLPWEASPASSASSAAAWSSGRGGVWLDSYWFWANLQQLRWQVVVAL